MSIQCKVVRTILSILEWLGFYNRFGAVIYPIIMLAGTYLPIVYLVLCPNEQLYGKSFKKIILNTVMEVGLLALSLYLITNSELTNKQNFKQNQNS